MGRQRATRRGKGGGIFWSHYEPLGISATYESTADFGGMAERANDLKPILKAVAPLLDDPDSFVRWDRFLGMWATEKKRKYTAKKDTYRINWSPGYLERPAHIVTALKRSLKIRGNRPAHPDLRDDVWERIVEYIVDYVVNGTIPAKAV